MFIVILSNGVRHSAWDKRNEAAKQLAVLREYGYKNPRIEFDDTVNCENGHYYI
jgi:hypothetical protein